MITFKSTSPLETFNIGFNLSKEIKSGDIIGLEGSLGSGKSVLIRGVLSGLGVSEVIPSPTFTLVNEYVAKFNIFHFDLYRLNNPYELYEIGFEEYVYSSDVSIIDWYKKAIDLLPEKMIKIEIRVESDNDRTIHIY
ncbi:MAG TPA: tRNA (adenosine(37)-N6)-threonylcarbamoyltransferase complex ATPase subunit type 1 TsaE [Spirochaetota bacterium]|nr:tRNA (adenosine(37)-N6)-threonylcarbamoyltransferase complex ATPase subunit type 1 TsaE [Spirochaetota bacterium]